MIYFAKVLHFCYLHTKKEKKNYHYFIYSYTTIIYERIFLSILDKLKGNFAIFLQNSPFKIPFLRVFCMFFCYTNPENPMNAIASRLAVIRAIGIPLNAFGTLLSASCSRRPAKRTIARPKPREVENAYHVA